MRHVNVAMVPHEEPDKLAESVVNSAVALCGALHGAAVSGPGEFTDAIVDLRRAVDRLIAAQAPKERPQWDR